MLKPLEAGSSSMGVPSYSIVWVGILQSGKVGSAYRTFRLTTQLLIVFVN